jgi:hypothetical protein
VYGLDVTVHSTHSGNLLRHLQTMAELFNLETFPTQEVQEQLAIQCIIWQLKKIQDFLWTDRCQKL